MIVTNPYRVRERLVEKAFYQNLPMILLRNGVLCDLIKVKYSKEREVYGHYAGQKIEDLPVTTLLCTGLPIMEARNSGSGMYGQGYYGESDVVYADYYQGINDDLDNCPSLDEGDVIRIHETDVQFIVTNISGIGPNNRIKRFNVSSIQSGIRPDQHSYPEKLTIK